MAKVAFDNELYIQSQSAHIRDRIAKFGGKLYLEFGGKLYDDNHASRVLPGFRPDSKLRMLLNLKDQVEMVIVINADKIVLTGKKLDQKYYYRHSGYIGGLKKTSYRELMRTKPELAVRLAVKGMLPKNTIGDKSIARLIVYRNDQHKQQAQQPIPVEVK